MALLVAYFLYRVARRLNLWLVSGRRVGRQPRFSRFSTSCFAPSSQVKSSQAHCTCKTKWPSVCSDTTNPPIWVPSGFHVGGSLGHPSASSIRNKPYPVYPTYLKGNKVGRPHYRTRCRACHNTPRVSVTNAHCQANEEELPSGDGRHGRGETWTKNGGETMKKVDWRRRKKKNRAWPPLDQSYQGLGAGGAGGAGTRGELLLLFMTKQLRTSHLVLASCRGRVPKHQQIKIEIKSDSTPTFVKSRACARLAD